jgi:oxygen-dependent protoporphyrinogen oxidase
MTGTLRVAVVGGGISGLAAAHRLVELGESTGSALEVSLLEGGDRWGGTIGTERDGEFVLERGPDSMITDKPWGLALAKRLGLESELIGTQQSHRRSFVVRAGRLLPVPEGFQLLAPGKFGPLITTPIFSPLGKARMALDLVLPPRSVEGDESLGSFVLRRLGREALDRMAQPMIAGIYGADPMELSLQATLPRFLEMEREYGSVIRGIWGRARKAAAAPGKGGVAPGAQSGVSGARYGLFVSFRRGMQTLVDALIEHLGSARLLLRSPVRRMAPIEGGWRLQIEGRDPLDVDRVVLAVPAFRAGELLRELNQELARLLESTPYAWAATLSLCYRRTDVPHPLDGFGFVVPAAENLSLLGCTFTNVKYPHRAPEGVALLRAFLGGPTLEKATESEVAARVREDLRRLLGVTAEPQFTRYGVLPRSMPQYRVGHLERVTQIEAHTAAIPGLAMAGNGLRGLGIPDCVRSGEDAAEAVFRAST